MANSKEIRRRIKSVKSIGQITKAMELVSAAKMRKAQAQALSSRPYAKLSSGLLENLASRVNDAKHPILNRILPEGETPSICELVVLISPEGGLAGALNSNLLNKTFELIKTEGREHIDFLTIGKKGAEVAARMGFKIIASFESKNRDLKVFDAKPVAEIVIKEYLDNHYSKIFIVYTNFISTLNQRPTILQLLPFSKTSDPDAEEYLFEPDPDAVWDSLVYRTVEFAIYQSMVEAAASEHSARMVAMRNANEAATDLVSNLELSYNQARQASITRELSEISAAKLAMEG